MKQIFQRTVLTFSLQPSSTQFRAQIVFGGALIEGLTSSNQGLYMAVLRDGADGSLRVFNSASASDENAAMSFINGNLLPGDFIA